MTMRRILVMTAIMAVCAASLAAAEPNTLTPAEAREGWVLLFDGQSLYGWTSEGGAQWNAAGGSINVESGEAGWLRSHATFADFVLKLDYKTGADGNSGVFLRSAREGAPHETGYELQIWDATDKFPTGSLVNHVRVQKVRRYAPDTWHSYEVTVEGDRWVIKLDGQTILETREGKSKAGHIGLQFNKDKPVAFRNIKVKPLGMKPIFNGKDLSGWQRVDNERAKEPPVWSVRDGMIHVEKGPGQLETTGVFQNFIMQLEIRANSQKPDHHPNSGVFFRGDAGKFWSGYESQIRNEYKDGDRTQPVDFGTGGIYRRQPARRVASNDNEFFTKTIYANGRQLCVWVNGELVNSWEDPNPEGMDVRQNQARLAGGTFSLQAHDPTTNLDFRNLRVAQLP